MARQTGAPSGRLVYWLGKGFIAVCIAAIAATDLFTPVSFASLQAQPAEDPRWTQFTHQQDDLISNNVRTLLAAPDALWFGTDAGISRYTGEWRAFPASTLGHSAEGGLDNAPREAAPGGRNLGKFAPPGQTTALALGASGHVWAGTDLGALAVWRSNGWHLLAHAGSPINALAVTEDGTWIGTESGLQLWHAGRLADIDALAGRPIYALTQDADTLWAGGGDGLWRYRSGRWAEIATNERWLAEGVYALWVDGQRTLWVGTRFGVAWRYYSSSRWQFIASVDEQGLPALVQSITADHSGAIWAATDGAGIFSFVEDGERSYSYGAGRDSGLSSRFVRGVVVDQDGSIWLATPAGVFRYQAYMWQSETVGAGTQNNLDFINDLLVDRQGRLWIATGGAGVRRKSAAGSHEVHYGRASGLPGIVLTLAEDNQGDIWAGTVDGLFRYRPAAAAGGDAATREGGGEGEWIEPSIFAGLPDSEITGLLVAGDILWIGTGDGLAGYHLRADSLFVAPELRGRRIEALAQDGVGNLWVGAEPGIHIFDTAGDYAQHRTNGGGDMRLPGGPVTGNGLARDPHNPRGMWANLWDVGLVYWDGEAWHRDPMGEHVAGSLVWDLSSSPEDGSLWIGSESGLTRYDGRTWALITAHDGLQTASIHAIANAPQGGYWIGGRNGLTHFRPDQTPPWIRVADLAGAAPTADGALNLVAGEETYLTIAVGDLQTPAHRMKVSYRVGRNGGNRDDSTEEIQWQAWQSTTNDVVPFQLDTPGDYRLEFQARDLAFNYSPQVGIDVQVARPSSLVTVPVLGAIPVTVLRILVVLGTLVIVGTLYITIELARYRRQSLDALKRKFNPYISGEPVRRDDMFFGRRALLQRIVDTLHHNSIMIHGERRIGKTTLLYQLASVLRDVDDADYWFVPVYIDLEGTDQEEFFHSLIEEIVHAVEASLAVEVVAPGETGQLGYRGRENRAYTDRDFNRDLRQVVHALQDYGEQHEPGKQARLILLLDEMDVVSGFDQLVQQQMRRIFMRDFAATVGAVVAGIRISKAWERVESPWFNLFNEIALEPFTREQGRELLVEPVRGYYRYRPEAVEFILDQAEGRPFRIQQYGLEAVNQMLLASRRTIHLQDAAAAHERLMAVEAAQVASTTVSQSRTWPRPWHPDGLWLAVPDAGDGAESGGKPTGDRS